MSTPPAPPAPPPPLPPPPPLLPNSGALPSMSILEPLLHERHYYRPHAYSQRQAIASKPDLSKISRGPLNIPHDDRGFVMSPALQHELAFPTTNDCDRLLDCVVKESTQYADNRKELVRVALKKKADDFGVALTPIHKNKLRSRREAKVHRVKEQEFKRALMDAMRWLIELRCRKTHEEEPPPPPSPLLHLNK